MKSRCGRADDHDFVACGGSWEGEDAADAQDWQAGAEDDGEDARG